MGKVTSRERAPKPEVPTDAQWRAWKARHDNQLFPLPEMSAWPEEDALDGALEPIFAAAGRALREHWAWFLLGIVAGPAPALIVWFLTA